MMATTESATDTMTETQNTEKAAENTTDTRETAGGGCAQDISSRDRCG